MEYCKYFWNFIGYSTAFKWRFSLIGWQKSQFNFGNRPFVLLAFHILNENQVTKKGSSKSIKLSHLSTSDYFSA